MTHFQEYQLKYFANSHKVMKNVIIKTLLNIIQLEYLSIWYKGTMKVANLTKNGRSDNIFFMEAFTAIYIAAFVCSLWYI